MNNLQNLAVFMAVVMILLLMFFYSVVGVAALHITQPRSETLGNCIKEAGTTWCRMEQ